MSNDFLNHLDAREKELWAELEKIDATRKLWQEPQQIKTVQRKEVRFVARKSAQEFDYSNVSAVFEYLGGLSKFKQCARQTKRVWLSSRKFGSLGYRVTLHDFGSRSATGKTEKTTSIGYFKTRQESDDLKKNLLEYYIAKKHNN